MHETITFLLVTLPNIHRFKKKFLIFRLSNKPFLIWLLTTPSHLKYAATVPCNLSLMDCFADINVSQCSVATHARWDFNMNLTANLLRNLPVKKFVNRLRFDRIVLVSVELMSVAQFFCPTLYITEQVYCRDKRQAYLHGRRLSLYACLFI